MQTVGARDTPGGELNTMRRDSLRPPLPAATPARCSSPGRVSRSAEKPLWRSGRFGAKISPDTASGVQRTQSMGERQGCVAVRGCGGDVLSGSRIPQKDQLSCLAFGRGQ